ncbi:hypothetical protein VTK56DRAFT_5439 [Thermocarpiscus australiensis]
MRLSLVLLGASAHLASADWLIGQELDGRGAQLLPKQTKASTPDGANGWTPRPTEAPFLDDGANPLELVRRREEWMRVKRQSSNTWVNEETCGWRAQTSSAPFTCGESSTCTTNTDRVVACLPSGATAPFYKACFDYQASLAGACESMGPKTGCCETSSIGSCITYLWPGPSPRSMYRCYTAQYIITMLDEPQFVLDAKTKTTSTSSSTSSTESATSPAQSTSVSPPPSSGGSSTNVGAIVGGVVGGVAGLALIAGAIAFFVIRSRHKKVPSGSGQAAYSAVAPGDTSYPGAAGYPPGASPQMSQAGYFPAGSVANTLRPESPYPNSSTTSPAAAAAAYHPHHSYYDPGHHMAEQQQQQQQQQGYPYHTPTPPGGYGAYPLPAKQPAASELDTTTVAAGQEGNPAEMDGTSSAPR